jgi:flagellar basal body-associated protein FliL
MQRIIIIVLAVLLAGGIGGVVASKLNHAPAKGEKVKEVKKEPEKFKTIELDEFIVNLADAQDQHYLKTEVVLEVADDGKGGGEGEDPFKELTPKIRDAMITTMTRRHFEELLTTQGKDDLKDSLKREINRVIGSNMVHEVYFTSFAMQ